MKAVEKAGSAKLLPFLLMSWTILCAVHLINILLSMQLNHFGVLPRHTIGLPGIILHPFLHGDWSHLWNNLVSFSLFSALIWQFKPRRLKTLIFIGTLVPGILLWFFARTSVHIGLSGVVYFLWAYILVYGFKRRSIKSVLIAVVVIILYGGMAWGILPIKQGMSFESHLFGMISGGIIGYWFAKNDQKKR